MNLVDAAVAKKVGKFVLLSSLLTNGAAVGQRFNPGEAAHAHGSGCPSHSPDILGSSSHQFHCGHIYLFKHMAFGVMFNIILSGLNLHI